MEGGRERGREGGREGGVHRSHMNHSAVDHKDCL